MADDSTDKLRELGTVPRPAALRAASSVENCLLKNRYRIIERIAIGGMAEVYLAAHGELVGFQTPVVIKRILPHLASSNEFIDMFLDEARIAASLHHPNIVSIIEVFHERREYFLVMELVQGESLFRLLRKLNHDEERMPPPLAATVAAHVAAGLHFAHTSCDVNGQPLNIVHRDVSPQNILVTYEGSVKVIDFGVARAMNRLTHTRGAKFKGKLGYSSPEHMRRDPIDGRSDQFALGVVLWEMLTGRRLFRRRTEIETVDAILSQPAPPPTAFVDVPQDLEQIVMRALNKEPQERFDSLQEMELALTACATVTSERGPSGLRAFMHRHFRPEILDWQRKMRELLELTTPSPESIPPHISMSVSPVVPAPPLAQHSPERRNWPLWAALGATVLLSVMALSLSFYRYRASREVASALVPATPAAASERPVVESLRPVVLQLAPEPAPAAVTPEIEAAVPVAADDIKVMAPLARHGSPTHPRKTGKPSVALKPNPFRE